MFGVYYTSLTNDQVKALATPPSGNSAECIFQQYYDSQVYTSAATTKLSFFKVSNNDDTITNLPQGGQLPAPQLMQVYDVCMDILPHNAVSSSTNAGGVLDDFAQIIFGYLTRGIWKLNVSSKDYGPYSLTTLHGTGGPIGFGFSSDGTNLYQYARNDCAPGWNYTGHLIIPEQVNFFGQMNWAAAATLQADTPYIRMSLFGVLNRRTS